MSNPNSTIVSDPPVFDDFDTEIQCEEVYGDQLPEFHEDDFEPFEADGGLTGDAQQFLGDIDREGGFV